MLRQQGRRIAPSGRRARLTAALTIAAAAGVALTVSSLPAGADPCLLPTPFGCEEVTPTSTTIVEPAPSTTTTVAPESTTTTAPPVAPAAVAARLLQLLNADRAAAGLARLEVDPVIEQIASGWSSAMAEAGTLSHNDRYFDRETRARLNAARLGENVAVAGDADQAHRALMASAPHRANVLDAGFTHVGVAAALHDGRWWFTEDFAQVKTPGGVAAAQAPDRARGGGGGDVRATRVVAASPVNGVEPIESLDTVPRPSGAPPTAVGATVLAGEDLPNPRAAAIAAAILVPVAVIALALRRRARADLVEARTEAGAAADDLVTRLTLASG